MSLFSELDTVRYRSLRGIHTVIKILKCFAEYHALVNVNPELLR